MKKKILICLFACFSIKCFAQEVKQSIPYTSIFSNGTTATYSYNKSTRTLKVDVSNNEDEVEVFAVKHGIVVESESTFFMNDKILLNLSEQGVGECDIYVQTENECLHIGSVDAGIKPEESK